MHRSETGGIVAEHCGGGNMSENEDGDGAPRQYIGPPRPRKGTAQALIWNFMMPYSSAEGSRNVECCILVPDADGSGMRKCGATFKHTMGGSTTNLLKHLRKKHPDEARKCLEGSKHSNVYKAAKVPGSSGMETMGSGGIGGVEAPPGMLPASGLVSVGGGGGNEGNQVDVKPTTSDAGNPGTTRQWETAVKKMVATGFAPETKENVRSARNFTLYCAVDLQPCSVAQEAGHMDFLTNTRGAAEAAITNQMFDTILSDERRKIVHQIYKAMQAQRQFVSHGPFCSLQLDTWSRQGLGNYYCVATISFVDASFDVKRLGLDCRSFAPGYKATDVRAWVQQITSEYFSGMLPNQVFVACTVGRGEHLVEAMMGLQVPIIQCCLKRLNQLVAEAMRTPHQHGSSSSSLPEHQEAGMSPLLARCKEMAQYLLQPSRLNPSLNKVQAAIGHDLCASELDPDSPSGTLQFLMAMLHVRPCITEHFREARPRDGPSPLTDHDWQTMCDAVGVLEACAEVDRTVRSMHFAGLTPALVLVNELQDYLQEAMLFVPEPTRGLDAHRVEKRADNLQAEMYRVRQTISEELHEQGLGQVATKQERIAAVLDISNKDVLLQDDRQLAAAWEELSSEYRRASARPGGGSSGGTGSGGGGVVTSDGMCAVTADGKRKWRGALTMRKEQRKRSASGPDGGPPTPGAEPPAGEIVNYRSLMQLSPSTEAEDALRWWAHHVRPSGFVSGWASPACTSFPVLSLIAAQYHSIDCSSTQADTLFEGVGYRLLGLQAMATANTIENMLFLRLNKDLIDRPLI